MRVPFVELKEIEKDLDNISRSIWFSVFMAGILMASVALWYKIISPPFVLSLALVLAIGLVSLLYLTRCLMLFEALWAKFFSRKIIDRVKKLEKTGLEVTTLEDLGLFSRKRFWKARKRLEEFEKECLNVIKAFEEIRRLLSQRTGEDLREIPVTGMALLVRQEVARRCLWRMQEIIRQERHEAGNGLYIVCQEIVIASLFKGERIDHPGEILKQTEKQCILLGYFPEATHLWKAYIFLHGNGVIGARSIKLTPPTELGRKIIELKREAEKKVELLPII
jgi:hypothetical protein